MEVALKEHCDLRIVDSMHHRKALMAELSDAVIALPGGLGTIEEFFEMVTWTQLGIHSKPCGLLNVCHYFDELMAFLDHSASQGFISAEHRSLIIIDDCSEGILEKFSRFSPPEFNKADWAMRLSEKLP
jgi:uncharacterized protein (TIGR00730 family)